MLSLQWCFSIICCFTFVALLLASASTEATSHHKNRTTYPILNVDPSGKKGDFRTIQSAIDSVPSSNRRWICIRIKKGVYREQVKIPYDKPFIYLKGDGRHKTRVVWDAHDSIATSAAFTSQADYTIARGIAFVNSYNTPNKNHNPMRPAVAARIEGDKSVFYRCGFFGVQDTLWDAKGRHYIKHCTIQGSVDFIFGNGQSYYERCNISVVARGLRGTPGYITAQGRSDARETSGFVFKDCTIAGNGKAYLGRPWRGHARVVFANTSMSEIVVPQGWQAWNSAGHEKHLTFSEHDSHGPGSESLRRVKWAKKLNEKKVKKLTDISFIDKEGWIKRLPFNILHDFATNHD